MKVKDKHGPNAAGYGILYAREISTLHETLQPEQVAAVLYNVGNYVARKHGYAVMDDMPMDDAQRMAYAMITDRIKTQLDHARYGAPKGNRNAEAKDKKSREAVVTKMHSLGMSLGEISRETGIPKSSVKAIVDKHKKPKVKIKTQDDVFTEAAMKVLYG